MDSQELNDELGSDGKRVSTRARLFDLMISKVQTGEWAVGSTIPSERKLMEELSVSRIALREALSMLRALGILEISHGKKTTVGRMNVEVIGRLFPLMLSLEGEQTLAHIFELRLALETQSAFLAAKRRTDRQMAEIEFLAKKYETNFNHDTPESIDVDHHFHVEIARATANPLYPILLDALGEFVKFAQRESGRLHQGRRSSAVKEHWEIVEAIKNQNSEKAEEAMKIHLLDAAKTE